MQSFLILMKNSHFHHCASHVTETHYRGFSTFVFVSLWCTGLFFRHFFRQICQETCRNFELKILGKGFFLLSQIILCSDLRSFHQLRLFLRYLFLHWQDGTRQDRRSHSYFQLCLYDRGWDRRTHLAKRPSDLKQNGTQENAPFSVHFLHSFPCPFLVLLRVLASKTVE